MKFYYEHMLIILVPYYHLPPIFTMEESISSSKTGLSMLTKTNL